MSPPGNAEGEVDRGLGKGFADMESGTSSAVKKKTTNRRRFWRCVPRNRSFGFDDVPRRQYVDPEVCSGIRHMPRSCFNYYEVAKYARFAIQDNNNKEDTCKLRLKKIIKCNLQAGCPFNYYITLEAEDIASGDVDRYQALVANLIPPLSDKVSIFRKVPKRTKKDRSKSSELKVEPGADGEAEDGQG